MRVLDDHAGRRDGYGNLLAVTAPALADEIAGAGDLAKGKLAMTPVAVVRGLGDLVLPAGDDGPGAAALVRDEGSDMFGYGAREAVLQALTEGDGRGFGDPAPAAELVTALVMVAGPGTPVRLGPDGREVVVDLPASEPAARGRLEARLEVAARAHGWRPANRREDDRLRFLVALP